MSTTKHPTVEQLVAQASRLDRAEQERLLGALIQLLHEEQSEREPVSIRTLRGLGRDIWSGVDAQEYVDKERQAWGG